MMAVLTPSEELGHHWDSCGQPKNQLTPKNMHAKTTTATTSSSKRKNPTTKCERLTIRQLHERAAQVVSKKITLDDFSATPNLTHMHKLDQDLRQSIVTQLSQLIFLSDSNPGCAFAHASRLKQISLNDGKYTLPFRRVVLWLCTSDANMRNKIKDIECYGVVSKCGSVAPTLARLSKRCKHLLTPSTAKAFSRNSYAFQCVCPAHCAIQKYKEPIELQSPSTPNIKQIEEIVRQQQDSLIRVATKRKRGQMTPSKIGQLIAQNKTFPLATIAEHRFLTAEARGKDRRRPKRARKLTSGVKRRPLFIWPVTENKHSAMLYEYEEDVPESETFAERQRQFIERNKNELD